MCVSEMLHCRLNCLVRIRSKFSRMASIDTQLPDRIYELDASVVNKLQNQTFLNSHAQVIKRLVTQAVSRHARSIKIIVDKTWSNIAFYDNGCSISESDIKKYICSKDANEDIRSTTLSIESALVFHAKRIEIKIVTPSNHSMSVRCH